MRALKALLPTLLLLGLAAPAQAATFNVDSLGEGTDATPGDGICATGASDCTVRAAVGEAAAFAGTDGIVLGPGTHTLQTRLDVIGHDVTIRGAGAGATTIDQTTAGEGVLGLLNTTSEIRDLAVTGGSANPGGGGLFVDVSGPQSVLVERVLIANNEASAASTNGFGGGIFKGGSGALTVRSSTISDNSVSATTPTVPVTASGGGIAHASGPLNLVNTTIQGNTALATGPGATSFGGGINSSGGATALSYVTLAANAATGDNPRGGNIASNSSGHLNVDNSIVAYGVAPIGAGCHVSSGGTLTSSGRNIDTGSTCAFGAPHLSNTDPLLLVQAHNGGSTPNFLPSVASPAVDAAIGCPTPAEDQRGVNRPAGAACDIGAVERATENGPGADLVAPIVSDFVISARRFRTGRASRRTRSLGRATNFVFHLSERALVDFRFERPTAGRRGRNGVCQRPARRNRGRRRCVRWVAVGSLADSLLEGAQSVRFNGSVTHRGRGRTLQGGTYRVRVEAIDPAGNHSAPVGGRFRIVR